LDRIVIDHVAGIEERSLHHAGDHGAGLSRPPERPKLAPLAPVVSGPMPT